MGEDIIESRNSAYFVYEYNGFSDLYMIKGITHEEISFEKARMPYIPEGLLKQIRREYVINHDVERFNEKVSISNDRVYAIVDFNGRTFTSDEIMRIVEAYDEAVSSIQALSKNKDLAATGEVVKNVAAIVDNYNKRVIANKTAGKSYTRNK